MMAVSESAVPSLRKEGMVGSSASARVSVARGAAAEFEGLSGSSSVSSHLPFPSQGQLADRSMGRGATSGVGSICAELGPAAVPVRAEGDHCVLGSVGPFVRFAGTGDCVDEACGSPVDASSSEALHAPLFSAGMWEYYGFHMALGRPLSHRAPAPTRHLVLQGQ